MRHGPKIIQEIKKLRRNGASISSIMKKLGLPQTTVWHNIRDIKLSEKILKNLRSRQGGSSVRKNLALNKAREEAACLLRSPKREKAIVLAMLYWAEGSKQECAFTNTDARMIVTFVTYLGDLFGLDMLRIHISIRTFEGMDYMACVAYWARVLKIPKKSITLCHNDLIGRGNSPYGLCRLRVKKGGYILKIINELVLQNAVPVVQWIERGFPKP